MGRRRVIDEHFRAQSRGVFARDAPHPSLNGKTGLYQAWKSDIRRSLNIQEEILLCGLRAVIMS